MKRGLCVIAAGLLLTACGSSEPDEYDAYTACENWVEERLRAPSTADFSGVGDSEITKTDAGYDVTGYVDAENGFGAQIRTGFTCRMELTADSWRLIELRGV